MSASPLPGATPAAPTALDLARRRFVRRALGTALLVFPLFLALGWWTSRSFLVREARFNELGLEVFVPRTAPFAVPIPVRCVTTDPLKQPHRAQLKWVSRDAAGNELSRGTEESRGVIEIDLLHADVARLDVRASDGAWGRDATVAIRRSKGHERVGLECRPLGSASSGGALLFAWRDLPRDAASTAPAPSGVESHVEADSACTWVAYDAAGVPLARRRGTWRNGFAVARWAPESKAEEAHRFDVQNRYGETLARCTPWPNGGSHPSVDAPERATLAVTSVDATAGVHAGADGVSEPIFSVLLLDAERQHAVKHFARMSSAEVDLPWVADAVPPAFVAIVNESGECFALREVPLAQADEVAVAPEPAGDLSSVRLRCTDRRGAPAPGVELWAFEARPTEDRSPHDELFLDPRAYRGAAEAGPDRARFGFGAFERAHSSAEARASIVEQRAGQELRARRIVFGVAIALASFCVVATLFELARRRRGRASSGALLFAAGGALLAVAFALVAARLWWGSDESDGTAVVAESAEAGTWPDFGSLEAIAWDAPRDREARLSGPSTSDERGIAELEIPWAAAANARRLTVVVRTRAGEWQRIEVELPAR